MTDAHPHVDAQQAVIDRARTELPKDDRVLGVLLIGSHATSENDAYSDVDLHLAISDDAVASFREDFPRLLELLAGPLVLAEPIPGLLGGLGITEDWLYVDLVAHPLAK